ncbi:MAG TPA: glycosyltransferase family 39 protein [Candidatus Aphodocola excrementigallinarum]|uniref:Glycosyltransferase family 39 protein n=1 Tax=Candidatus Aphodocola excrementigallinarum TaxID=2840670 RepID=A0A9D1IPY3_9FIRM|nr:glycosyltransferase family 39 protein [Candidatus Aphodocola excrementigallinarum]
MKNKNILSNLFMYFTIIVFSIITLIFLMQNNIIISILAYLVVIFVSLKNNIKKFPIILFVTSLVIRLAMIFIFNFAPVSDFETLLNASKDFANGDFSIQNEPYFTTWGYQTGFVIYQGIILKIFNSVFVLKVLNAIFSSVLCLLVYLFGKKICSEKSARMASLLYMIFPFSLYMNTILANHHIATFLTYIGIFFLLKDNKKIKDYVIAAVLISFGNIMRPEGIIVLFSLLLFEIFRLKKDLILKTIRNLLIFFVIYFAIGIASSLIVQKTGINDAGLSNNNPQWKFVLGFNHDSCGYYSAEDEKYLNDKEEEIEVIKERINVSPLKMAKLMTCKVNHFWLQSDISSKNEMYSNKAYNVLGMQIKFTDVEKVVISFNTILYIITFLMCIIGVIFNRKKIIKDNSFFFVIMIMVTFFVYLLIEIQPRYAYFIHVSIFILSTYGYEIVLNKIKKLLNKKNKMKLRS